MGQFHAGHDDPVQRAVDGDADCLEALVRDATPALRKGLSIEPRWQRCLDADDVLQVTFLEAFLRIRSLETRTVAGFHAWLQRIAERNLLDAVRALGRDKRDDARRVTRGPAGESSRTLLLTVAGENRTAGGAAVLADEIARLHDAIGQLPASYRTVVEQVDLRERPLAEVAAGMRRSIGAVHMLRSRAHDRLHELLKG